jgi:hypothetical protein
MRYEPWTPKREPKPVVFIVDANAAMLEFREESGGKRYRTVNSAESWLTKYGKTAVIYSLVPAKQLILFNGAQNWKVIQYHERNLRMIYKGEISVHCWAAFGPDPQELMPFFDALKELGVPPASMSTMAMNSWKRTIHRRYSIVEFGPGPKVGRSAFIGGRKEALQPVPATYSGAIYLDLPAAYLNVMKEPIPIYLMEKEPEWYDEGIAEAIVEIPEQPWNPLPFRIGKGKRGLDLEVYGYGRGRGRFVLSELRNAVENHGVKAELVRVWKGYKPHGLFDAWLPWALDLRKLPGNSGQAAKNLTTRLWSMFGQNPVANRKVEITFEDRKGLRKIRTEIPDGRGSHRVDGSVFLSAIIASRVRVRLLEELIPAGAVYVDTDGGIVPSTAQVPGWATKRTLDLVEIRSSQAYRWQCGDCPNCSHRHNGRHPTSPWHYSVAGMRVNDPYLPDIFERMNRHQLLRMRSYASVAIPAQDLSGAQQWVIDQDIEAVPDETL